MTPFWGADEAVARWVAAHIDGCERGFGRCRALGVANRDGEIVAGVVFHNWWPERGLIEISCAAETPRWFTRDVMRAAWGYAFSVARLALGQHSERNAPARRIWKASGAAEALIPDLYAEGEAGVIATLTRQQWEASRLGGRHGQA